MNPSEGKSERLTEQVRIKFPDGSYGKAFRIIAEEDATRKKAHEGVLLAGETATDRLLTGDITPKLARILRAVRELQEQPISDTLSRFHVALLSRGAASAVLTEDLIASAHRASAIALLNLSLSLLDESQENREFIIRVFNLRKEINDKRTDHAQFNVINKADRKGVLIECANRLYDYFRKVEEAREDFNAQLILRAILAYRKSSGLEKAEL